MRSFTPPKRGMVALLVLAVVLVALGGMLLIGLVNGNQTDQLDIQNGHNAHNGEVINPWR